MSKDKRRAESRQNALLLRALAQNGLTIHHLGGMARNDPDLQALLRRGLMMIPLNRGTPPKWSREFDRFFGGPLGIHGHAPRLGAYLTPAGREMAERLKAAQVTRFSVASLIYGKDGRVLYWNRWDNPTPPPRLPKPPRKYLWRRPDRMKHPPSFFVPSRSAARS